MASGEQADRRAVRAARSVVFLYKEFEGVCRELGVSVPQYRLLVFLRSGPQRAGELAASAAIKRPTLTALVDGLVREQRIRRVPVEADRRGIRLELTDAGIEILKATDVALGNLVADMASQGDRDSILDGLSALAEVMGRAAADGGSTTSRRPPPFARLRRP